MVRFSWYTPRCTMIVSPGDACRIALWIECPGHTCPVASDAVPENASSAARASANVRAVRLIVPPLGACCRREATPGSADCKGSMRKKGVGAQLSNADGSLGRVKRGTAVVG